MYLLSITYLKDMQFKPLSDNVLIKSLENEHTTDSGIVIPDSAKDKSSKGTVVAVGPGKIDDNGKQKTPSVKVGDVVLIREYGFSEIELDKEKYLIGSEDNIFGILS